MVQNFEHSLRYSIDQTHANTASTCRYTHASQYNITTGRYISVKTKNLFHCFSVLDPTTSVYTCCTSSSSCIYNCNCDAQNIYTTINTEYV